MKRSWLLLLFLPILSYAQKAPEISLAFTNYHTVYPFSSFSKLFTGPFHPGVELGYRFNWRNRPKHDWYQTIHAGYFYHRFLQHAIPISTQVGYRYKVKERLGISSAIGLGYLHAIPDAAILQLNENGDYENAKGIGRSQALVSFSLVSQYRFHSRRPVSIFLEYRQMIQAPFVKSYVPLLPYNGLALGATLSVKPKSGK